MRQPLFSVLFHSNNCKHTPLNYLNVMVIPMISNMFHHQACSTLLQGIIYLHMHQQCAGIYYGLCVQLNKVSPNKNVETFKQPVGPVQSSVSLSWVSVLHHVDELHHLCAYRHEMALSHLPVFCPRKKLPQLWREPQVNPLFLFGTSGESLRGAGRRDSTTRRCRHKARTVCVSGELFEGVHDEEFVRVIQSVRGCDRKRVGVSLLVCLTTKPDDKAREWVYPTPVFFLRVSPLWIVFVNTPTRSYY